MEVPFVDLSQAYFAQKEALDAAVARVMARGWYILGEEVQRFETEFAAFCGSDQAVGVASGTDALLLALRAFDIGPGDEVITVAHTAVATAAAIMLCGATPVFVDVDPTTYTLDPSLLAGALTKNTKAIVPVHLYGHTADLDPILAFAAAHGLLVIEDCAQAHGAAYRERVAGSLGHAAAFSFYPTKNLGAMGDGGAIVCRDPQTADRLRTLRQYGWRERYVSTEVGENSRLDELQAAILRVRLQTLEQDNELRRQAAALYSLLLQDSSLLLPLERAETRHVYHLFVVQAPQRDELRAYLSEHSVGTAVHYPVPVHLQPAYRHLGYTAGSLPVSEKLAQTILSLPLYPQIKAEHIRAVAAAVSAFYS